MDSSSSSSASSTTKATRQQQRYLVQFHDGVSDGIVEDVRIALSIGFPESNLKKTDFGFTFFPKGFTRREAVLRCLGFVIFQIWLRSIIKIISNIVFGFFFVSFKALWPIFARRTTIIWQNCSAKNWQNFTPNIQVKALLFVNFSVVLLLCAKMKLIFSRFFLRRQYQNRQLKKVLRRLLQRNVVVVVLEKNRFLRLIRQPGPAVRLINEKSQERLQPPNVINQRFHPKHLKR